VTKAAVRLFREQRRGHFIQISSIGEARLAEMRAWRETSVSTDFPAAPERLNRM
jgi:hypothetical protein